MFESEKTNEISISCKGKEAPFDHPLVYLKIEKSIGFINCPYCSKKFELTSVQDKDL